LALEHAWEKYSIGNVDNSFIDFIYETNSTTTRIVKSLSKSRLPDILSSQRSIGDWLLDSKISGTEASQILSSLHSEYKKTKLSIQSKSGSFGLADQEQY
jgi:hypothetical protein